jgi:hypothetical protein
MPTECRTCLGEHDEEIHSATLAVHNWFQREVTQWLDDETDGVFQGKEDVPAEAAA